MKGASPFQNSFQMAAVQLDSCKDRCQGNSGREGMRGDGCPILAIGVPQPDLILSHIFEHLDLPT